MLNIFCLFWTASAFLFLKFKQKKKIVFFLLLTEDFDS